MYKKKFIFFSVRQIRFVTDYMLGSIGKVLRQIGIDTWILKGDIADHDECIKYSQREDRIVLTASKQLMINKVSQIHVVAQFLFILLQKYFSLVSKAHKTWLHFLGYKVPQRT